MDWQQTGGYNRINKVGKTSVNEHKNAIILNNIFQKKYKRDNNIALPYLVIGIAPNVLQLYSFRKYYRVWSKVSINCVRYKLLPYNGY